MNHINFKKVQTIISKKYFFVMMLAVLLIPSIYIHKTNDSDWGDDYVQYIYQSQHLFEKNYDYKTVINPLQHAPVKRGVLFSLFLSLNQNIHNILAYKNLICFSYILAGILVFLFLSQHFSKLESLLLTLCVFYNYRNLWLKDEIAAEYLMMVFVYLIFFLQSRPNTIPPLLYGFLFACLLSIRLAGAIFLLAFLLHFIFNKTENGKLAYLLKLLFWLCLLMLCFELLLPKTYSSTEISFYKEAFLQNINPTLLYNNIAVYTQSISQYFEQEIPHSANVFLIFLSMAFLLFGIIFRFLQKWQFIEFGFLLYLLVLLFWDNSGTPNRYLIPILPMLFFYIFYGLKQFLGFLKFNQKKMLILSASYLLIILLSNVNTIFLFKANDRLPIGPLSELLKNDFLYIQKTTPKNAVIAFNKPLVMNLCCNRNSFALKDNTQMEALNKSDYFLIARNPLLEEIFEAGKKIKVSNVDTIALENFWLLRLKQQ